MKITMKKTLLSVSILFASNQASAAAFQLAELSTSGLGRAYSGEAAIADNAAVVATNPALMSKFKTMQFSAGSVYVHSRVRMEGPVTAKLAGATLAKESANKESVVPGSSVPNMYFVAPLNDKFAVGGGMNVNFGLKSEYADDYNAGVFGGTTDLTALNLNLSGSYRITEGFSAGLGINAVYASAKVERRAGIIDTALSNAMQSPAVRAALSNSTEKTTVLTHLQDKAAWAFGWNAGLMYEINERNRFGLAYHSKIDIDFKDRNALSYKQTATGIGPYVAEGGLVLKLPAYWEFSGFHQLTDKFAVHYSYKYTEWKRFKNLHATYTDGQLAFHKDENYRNNSRIALGATYDVNEQLTVRAGIAYDEAAATRKHASASIPDTNRTWYSVGATYKFTPNLAVDLGFAHLRGKRLNFTEEQTIAGLLNVKAEYHSKARANLYGLNINYSF